MVTMRPRMLMSPATSASANGTGVIPSAMKTSCTRDIGSPKSCPPIVAVTYITVLSGLSFIVVCSRRTFEGGRLLLDRRDQSLPIEFGDVIVETDLPAARDSLRRHHGRQADDRN